jgi:hypothetical protein
VPNHRAGFDAARPPQFGKGGHYREEARLNDVDGFDLGAGGELLYHAPPGVPADGGVAFVQPAAKRGFGAVQPAAHAFPLPALAREDESHAAAKVGDSPSGLRSGELFALQPRAKRLSQVLPSGRCDGEPEIVMRPAALGRVGEIGKRRCPCRVVAQPVAPCPGRVPQGIGIPRRKQEQPVRGSACARLPVRRLRVL